MRDPSRLRLFVVVLALAVILAACGEKPFLTEVSFDRDRITPNADGNADALKITYGLDHRAQVSITFEDQQGQVYTFRDHARRGPSVDKPYEVLFSGVVDGYRLPDETFTEFDVEKRVLQDGEYIWTVEATDEAGDTEQVTGKLTIADADTALPELQNFSVSPNPFTPNRDGITDRAKINVSLSKDDTSLSVYLLDEDGTRYPVEKDEQTLAREGKSGLYAFDYDAGVDDGAQPPPDGQYVVFAEAEDRIGQRTLATTTLTIENGGVPMAYIFNGEVEWSSRSVPLGETLHFTLTVENDSPAPIRTSGPAPGTVYESDQNYATLGEYIQSGAFRVAIHCENAITNYPWRWAAGDEDALEERDGHLYLPPFTRAVVTGGIRFMDVAGARNPQYCWAGLIHEDVEISPVNDRVHPVSLLIEVP